MSCEQILSNRISNRLNEFVYNKNDYDNVKNEIISDTLDCRLKERNKWFLKKRIFRQNVFNDNKIMSIENYLGVISVEQYKNIQNGEFGMYRENNNVLMNNYIHLVNERKRLEQLDNFINYEGNIEALFYSVTKSIEVPHVEFQYEALRILNVMIKQKLFLFEQLISKLPSYTLNKILSFLNTNIKELINSSIKFFSNTNQNQIRSFIIEKSIYQKLILLYSTNDNICILQKTLKLLKKIIFIHPILPYNKVFTIFNHTIKHILTIDDGDLNLRFLFTALEFIDEITNIYKESINDLIESNLITNDLILKFAYQNENMNIKMKAMRICGNIALGNANETEIVTKFRYRELYKLNLQHLNAKIREETAWLISNIVCDVEKHKELFIENGFFEIMKQMIYQEKVYFVLKQIIWALCNILTVRKEEIYMKLMYENGGIDLIEQMFNIGENDPHLVCVVIELMKNILDKETIKFQYNERHVYLRFLKFGIRERFERILLNQNTICSEQINYILNNYLNNFNE